MSRPSFAPTSTGSRPTRAGSSRWERLTALDRLKRKHGGTIELVVAHAERCREEIAKLENAEELTAELGARVGKAEARRAALAAELTSGRAEAAERLAVAVAAELAELAMDGARLEVRLDPHPGGLARPAPRRSSCSSRRTRECRSRRSGEAASGGEISRIMLALTGLAGEAESTIVFDEIDAGIGGATAHAGRRTAEAAR